MRSSNKSKQANFTFRRTNELKNDKPQKNRFIQKRTEVASFMSGGKVRTEEMIIEPRSQNPSTTHTHTRTHTHTHTHTERERERDRQTENPRP